MSFVDERKAFETRMATNWTATPIQWQNVPFDPPRNTTGWLPYVAFNVMVGRRDILSIGAQKKIRNDGMVDVQIFIPRHHPTAMGLALQYAETIRGLFELQSLQYGSSGYITTFVTTLTHVGARDGYEQSNVSTPYWRDTV